jgi:hypothetical protein
MEKEEKKEKTLVYSKFIQANIDSELYVKVLKKARREKTTISAVLRKALEDSVSR